MQEKKNNLINRAKAMRKPMSKDFILVPNVRATVTFVCTKNGEAVIEDVSFELIDHKNSLSHWLIVVLEKSKHLWKLSKTYLPEAVIEHLKWLQGDIAVLKYDSNVLCDSIGITENAAQRIFFRDEIWNGKVVKIPKKKVTANV